MVVRSHGEVTLAFTKMKDVMKAEMGYQHDDPWTRPGNKGSLDDRLNGMIFHGGRDLHVLQCLHPRPC